MKNLTTTDLKAIDIFLLFKNNHSDNFVDAINNYYKDAGINADKVSVYDNGDYWVIDAYFGTGGFTIDDPDYDSYFANIKIMK